MPFRGPWGLVWALGMVALLGFMGCSGADFDAATPWQPPTAVGAGPPWSPSSLASPPPSALVLPPTRGPGTPIWTPTPDPPRSLPTPRGTVEYVVQPGDTLAGIAMRFSVPLQMLMEANGIQDPNWISVGRVLIIPPPVPVGEAPGLKLLPDSELVYGPYAGLFDVYGFVRGMGGYLAQYTEVVDGELMDGPSIVHRVAVEYSVNPRLLLALLEYQSRWVTQPTPDPATLTYPLGFVDPRFRGLWKQLSWAANELNRGYYLWQAGALGGFLLADGNWVRGHPQVNAGTAAVQRFLGLIYDDEAWKRAVGPRGVLATYQELFGWPFDFAFEPLVPPDVEPPPLALFFPEGDTWYFTGGPHSAWGTGTPWGSIDFAPGDGPLGCYLSPSWATAAADGLVVRSRYGVVALDLDMDGYEQTGWVLVYLHLATQDRVPEGALVQQGERLGHPSCEGGISTGTHVHFAWKYNGQWIAAFGRTPMVLSGWRVESAGKAYDGWLVRGEERIEACACRDEKNAVTHLPGKEEAP